jgi:hypothetical protein
MTPEERARLNRLPHWARPIALALADAWSLLTLNGAGGWKHKPETIQPASITVYGPPITKASGIVACISTDMHDADDWEGCVD